MCKQDSLSVESACRLFGHCKQAYYQHRTDTSERFRREARVIDAADWTPGRDKFFAMLESYGLGLPRPKPRHTTNSNHRYHKYKNLIIGFVPTAANRLWVSDITYIDLEYVCCYLHLVTDAYSHKIIG